MGDCRKAGWTADEWWALPAALGEEYEGDDEEWVAMAVGSFLERLLRNMRAAERRRGPA